MSKFLDELKADSHLSGGNAAFVEELYESFLGDPQSVSPQWRTCFEGLIQPGVHDFPHRPVVARFRQLGRLDGKAAASVAVPRFARVEAENQAQVLRLINAYRVRGHQRARLDPLESP